VIKNSSEDGNEEVKKKIIEAVVYPGSNGQL
jgi:hypothetical protein